MKSISILAILFPLVISAQTKQDTSTALSENPGIHFEQASSWKEIVEKAHSENKYIFVDCFTTWCGPCREMEKSVYPLEKVGQVLNRNFLSLKVQMDTSKKDDEFVRNWYADAHYILEKYKPEGYPSYLFFTPDGRILNRGLGAKSPDDFISMITDVLNPDKDFYKLLNGFQHGKRDFTEMSFLARTGLALGDTATARKVAKAYFSLLRDKSILTKENIQFLSEFTKSSGDVGFKWLYLHAGKIDSIMGDDTYSEHFVQMILYKEIVIPHLEKVKKTSNLTPDWDALKRTIQKKYNDYYAGRIIAAARSSWGLNHKDLAQYTKYLVIYEDNYGSKTGTDMMASLTLNNYAWAIFENSNKPEELKAALNWSTRAIMMYPNPGWMDTYANILYKLGRNKESIMWEEIATKLSPSDKGFQDTLEKMKKGQPTWAFKN